MELAEYERTIAQWWLNKQGQLISLEGATLGLVGESGEFMDALVEGKELSEVIKEAGDVFWYVAAICKNLGASFEALSIAAQHLYSEDVEALLAQNRGIFHHVAQVSDNVKKYTWHGKDDQETLLKIQLHLSCSFMLVADALRALDVMPHVALQMNVDKLRKRYPDGFVQGGGIR